MGSVGNLFGFPAVKEFWKSVKNWQSYRHEFGVLIFWGHRLCVNNVNVNIEHTIYHSSYYNNKNLAIANRSRVSCADNALRAL